MLREPIAFVYQASRLWPVPLLRIPRRRSRSHYLQRSVSPNRSWHRIPATAPNPTGLLPRPSHRVASVHHPDSHNQQQPNLVTASTTVFVFKPGLLTDRRQDGQRDVTARLMMPRFRMIITIGLFLIQAAARTTEVAPEMTIGGWIFMAAAWIFIISLTYYTFAKVLRGSRK